MKMGLNVLLHLIVAEIGPSYWRSSSVLGVFRNIQGSVVL